MKVAIIPARGGSKRIPQKNIREFCGMPMIAWSIAAAESSGLFDRIIVSTDDRKIRDIAISAGAEVPFERPEELSNDVVGTVPVVRHAVESICKNDGAPDSVCCIYATAPFLSPEYLKQGNDRLEENLTTDFVFSATKFSFPIFRALRCGDGNAVSMFWPEHEQTRSQDLPNAYHDAGQFYWGRTDAWLTRAGIFSAESRIVELPPHLVQDIDTPDDWALAELKFEVLRAAAAK